MRKLYRLLLAASAFLALPAFAGEILLSGAVYFDSENTLLEVKKLIKDNNQEGLVRLFDGNHISAKQTTDLTIILLTVGPEPESPAEFRFADKPTTYWTFSRYVKAAALAAAPMPSATPSATPTPPVASVQELLGQGGNDPLPSSTPASTPDLGPLSTPSPRPKPTPSAPNDPPSPSPSPALAAPTPGPIVKVGIAPTPTPGEPVKDIEISKDGKIWRKVNGYWYPKEEESPSPTPLRRRHRHYAARGEKGDEVPEEFKVWHRDAAGHLKWYDKRNLHEVRRAEPVEETTSANPTPKP